MAFMKTSVAIQAPTTFDFNSKLPGDALKELPPEVVAEDEEEEEEEEPTASALPSQTKDN